MALISGAGAFEKRERAHSDPVPLVILDEEFCFSMVNTAAEKVFQGREDQLLGLSIREVIPEWPIQAWEEPIPEAIERISVFARNRLEHPLSCSLSLSISTPKGETRKTLIVAIQIFKVETEPKAKGLASMALQKEELLLLEDKLGNDLHKLREFFEQSSLDPELMDRVTESYRRLVVVMRTNRGLEESCASPKPVVPVEEEHQHEEYPMLVVDDNPTNRLILRKMLNRMGFATDEAEDGRVAVDMVKAKPYSLIWLDIQMPVLDGREACREMRLLEGRGDIPIIAASSESIGPDEIDPMAFNGRLVKPFTEAKLKEVLARFVTSPAARGNVRFTAEMYAE